MINQISNPLILLQIKPKIIFKTLKTHKYQTINKIQISNFIYFDIFILFRISLTFFVSLNDKNYVKIKIIKKNNIVNGN